MQLIELSAAKEKFEKVSQEYRTKASVLHQELANNEAVQKDFVKLSQSLQVRILPFLPEIPKINDFKIFVDATRKNSFREYASPLARRR